MGKGLKTAEVSHQRGKSQREEHGAEYRNDVGMAEAPSPGLVAVPEADDRLFWKVRLGGSFSLLNLLL